MEHVLPLALDLDLDQELATYRMVILLIINSNMCLLEEIMFLFVKITAKARPLSMNSALV